MSKRKAFSELSDRQKKRRIGNDINNNLDQLISVNKVVLESNPCISHLGNLQSSIGDEFILNYNEARSSNNCLLMQEDNCADDRVQLVFKTFR